MSDYKEHVFLTKSRLTDIVRKVEGTDRVSVSSATTRAGSAAGDNYSADLVACEVAATVEGEDKRYSWMVKLSPDPNAGGTAGSAQVAFTAGMHMEEAEIFFYDKILPAWNKIARDRGAAFRLNCFSAPYSEFHPDGEGRSILVMQDLRPLGFSHPENKFSGLSEAHAKMALSELAKFHALSHVWLETYPGGGVRAALDENKVFTTDYFYVEPTSTIRDLNNKTVDALAKVLGRIQEPGENLAGAVRAFDADVGLIRRRTEAFSPNAAGFNVINFGDAWFNNMMFKHDDEGTPTECSLLDISFCRYASPCVDLAYFLFTSTAPSLRQTRLPHLLRHYHDSFAGCLTQLGEEDPASVYPFDRLTADFDFYAYCGFSVNVVAFALLPIITGQKREEQEEVDPQAKTFLGAAVRDMIRRGIFK